jgi:hypothetical protein
VISRIGQGMEAISKMKPESRKVGRKAESSATWLATNWFLVADEMNRPSPSEGIRKAEAMANNVNTDPRNGSAKIVTAITVQSAIETRPSR